MDGQFDEICQPNQRVVSYLKVKFNFTAYALLFRMNKTERARVIPVFSDFIGAPILVPFDVRNPNPHVHTYVPVDKESVVMIYCEERPKYSVTVSFWFVPFDIASWTLLGSSFAALVLVLTLALVRNFGQTLKVLLLTAFESKIQDIVRVRY